MEIERVDQIIEKHHGEASNLLQIMLDIQKENNWLSKQALARVSEQLSVPMHRMRRRWWSWQKSMGPTPTDMKEIHPFVSTAACV